LKTGDGVSVGGKTQPNRRVLPKKRVPQDEGRDTSKSRKKWIAITEEGGGGGSFTGQDTDESLSEKNAPPGTKKKEGNENPKIRRAARQEVGGAIGSHMGRTTSGGGVAHDFVKKGGVAKRQKGSLNIKGKVIASRKGIQ